MNIDNISLISAIFIKLMALLGLLIYVAFAGILVRQEYLMTKVMRESSEPLLRALVIAHFVASLVVFVAAIILL